MKREEAIAMLKSKIDGSIDTSYEWAETVRMAIEALLILGEYGIINCCGCTYWNEYGFCNLTDKLKKGFDYCSDGRRE